jgi:hypothetical protein
VQIREEIKKIQESKSEEWMKGFKEGRSEEPVLKLYKGLYNPNRSIWNNKYYRTDVEY